MKTNLLQYTHFSLELDLQHVSAIYWPSSGSHTPEDGQYILPKHVADLTPNKSVHCAKSWF